MKLLSFLHYILYKCLYTKSYCYSGNGVALLRLNLKGQLSIINKGKFVYCKVKVIGRNNTILLDENTNLKRCSILIKGSNCVVDIRGGRLMIGSSIELLDSNTRFLVKSNTGFNKNRIVVAGIGNSVDIGSDCVFAEHAEIWASDTHSILDMETNTRINIDKPIHIEDKVWIGNRTLIMKGVTIGTNSVIGAGSIVTKDIEPHSLATGIPARSIRTNIKWDINRL